MRELCPQGSIGAPFGPSLIWTFRIVIQKELIEDDIDAGVAKMLAKDPDALPLVVIGLSIANEYAWQAIWSSRRCRRVGQSCAMCKVTGKFRRPHKFIGINSQSLGQSNDRIDIYMLILTELNSSDLVPT